MTKIKDRQEALRFFEEAATEHPRATETGDYKTANKNYSKIVKAMGFLKEQGQIQLVSKFLTHELEGVRIWAAAYLLPVEEESAIRVLSVIAKGRGIQSLNAETTLSEWQKGNLRL